MYLSEMDPLVSSNINERSLSTDYVEEVQSSSYLGRVWKLITYSVNKLASTLCDSLSGRCCLRRISPCKVVKRYSDVLASLIILSVDIVYLVGEVDPNAVSEEVTSTAFMSLSYIGLVSLPYTVHWFCKSVRDIKLSLITSNQGIFFDAFTKTVVLGVNILLVGSDCVAATYIECGNVDSAMKIYKKTRVIALVNMIIGSGLGLIHLWTNQWFIEKMKEGIPSEDLLKICVHYKALMNSEIPHPYPPEPFAASIIQRMDKDTVEVLLDSVNQLHLDHENIDVIRELFDKAVLENLKTAQYVEKSDIFLKITGEVAVVVSGWYPYSTTQAAIWTGFSALYTLTLMSQKFRQIKNRDTAQEIVEDNTGEWQVLGQDPN